MEWHEIILNYLKVIASWPVMAVVVALIFRNELRKLPSRLEQVIVGKNTVKVTFTPQQAKQIKKDLEKAAKKPAMSKRQQEQLQKDIDQVFELGVALGLGGQGKTIADVSNVQLLKDEKGNVTGLQYDETSS